MTTSTPSNRRRFLQHSGAALALPLLGATGLPAQAQTAPRKIIVATWGGDYSRLLDQNVSDPLLKPKGLAITYDTSNWQTRVAKLRAEQNSRRGSYDVAFLGDTETYGLSKLEVLESLDASKIPHWNHILPVFRKPYGVPHIYSGLGLIYNTERVKSAPESFKDLADPAFKGRIGFSDIMYANNIGAAAVAAGGEAHDLERGFDLLRKIKANQPRLYPSNEALAAALKSGEVDVTIMWKARAHLWKKAGLPVAFAAFKEKILVTVYEAAVPRNSLQKASAFEYANALVDASAQVGFADSMGFLPVVDNAPLSPELRSSVDFSEAERARFARTDFDKLIAVRPKALDFWDKEFKVGL